MSFESLLANYKDFHRELQDIITNERFRINSGLKISCSEVYPEPSFFKDIKDISNLGKSILCSSKSHQSKVQQFTYHLKNKLKTLTSYRSETFENAKNQVIDLLNCELFYYRASVEKLKTIYAMANHTQWAMDLPKPETYSASHRKLVRRIQNLYLNRVRPHTTTSQAAVKVSSQQIVSPALRQPLQPAASFRSEYRPAMGQSNSSSHPISQQRYTQLRFPTPLQSQPCPLNHFHPFYVQTGLFPGQFPGITTEQTVQNTYPPYQVLNAAVRQPWQTGLYNQHLFAQQAPTASYQIPFLNMNAAAPAFHASFNHSYSHPDQTQMEPNQLNATQQTFADTIAIPPLQKNAVTPISSAPMNHSSAPTAQIQIQIARNENNRVKNTRADSIEHREQKSITKRRKTSSIFIDNFSYYRITYEKIRSNIRALCRKLGIKKSSDLFPSIEELKKNPKIKFAINHHNITSKETLAECIYRHLNNSFQAVKNKTTTTAPSLAASLICLHYTITYKSVEKIANEYSETKDKIDALKAGLDEMQSHYKHILTELGEDISTFDLDNAE